MKKNKIIQRTKLVNTIVLNFQVIETNLNKYKISHYAFLLLFFNHYIVFLCDNALCDFYYILSYIF